MDDRNARIDAWAARLSAAYGTAPVAARPDDGPATPAEAYAIQSRTGPALGPVGGFKTGRKQPEAAPIMAPVRAATIWPSGSVIPPQESRLRGFELEIAFRLEHPLPDPTAPGFAARLRAGVVALPALEIVESRLADPEAAGPLWKLADGQSNHGMVLGAPVADWRSLDPVAPQVRLRLDGTPLWAGAAPVPGGDAFDTFVAFARRVGAHCGGLQPGQVVLTGSVTGLAYATAGQRVEGWIAGLGPVAARFA